MLCSLFLALYEPLLSNEEGSSALSLIMMQPSHYERIIEGDVMVSTMKFTEISRHTRGDANALGSGIAAEIFIKISAYKMS
jgi:hypothetical protein